MVEVLAGSRANVTEMSTAATRSPCVCPHLYLSKPFAEITIKVRQVEEQA